MNKTRITSIMKKVLLILTFIIIVSPNSYAEDAPPRLNWINGPQTVHMGANLSELKLSRKYLFLNSDDTKKLMRYEKDIVDNDTLGLILPNTEDKNWSVILNYSPIGYVKDDEGKSLNADQILKSISEATEEGNKEREKLGSSSRIHVIDWVEKPHYDSQTHHLIWSILAKDEQERNLINYNTKILGRSGITSILLVTTPDNFISVKPNIVDIVKNYYYSTGQTYAEFIPGKDKVAEIGLAALIIGGTAVAAKTGFLTKMFLFALVAFKKLWIILTVGFFAFFKKLFGTLINILKSPFQKKQSSFDALKQINSIEAQDSF